MKYRKVSAVQTGEYMKPVLRIYARGEDGKKYWFDKSGLDSYFFMAYYPRYGTITRTSRFGKDQQVNLNDKVKDIVPGYTSIFGEPLWKVYTYAPGDTNDLRMHPINKQENKGRYDHYEADVHWTERACIDLKLTDGFEWDADKKEFIINNDVDHIQLKTWIIDIEVSSPPTVSPDEFTKDPKYQTVCIVVQEAGKTRDQQFVFQSSTMNEHEMWEEFLTVLNREDPDILTGWNVSFDISWIFARLEYLKFDLNRLASFGRAGIRVWKAPHGAIITKYSIDGRVVLDGLEAYKVKKNPSGQLSSYNLHAIAEKELQTYWEDLGPRIEASWLSNPQSVIDYCRTDVENETAIVVKERLIEQALSICRLSGCSPEQTTKKEAIIDKAMLLRRGDRILPSKRRTVKSEMGTAGETIDNEVTGAVVLTPRPGMHDYIGVFDAAALYPSIITGFNISPETKDENGPIAIDAEWTEIVTDVAGKISTNKIKKTIKFKSAQQQLGILPESITEFRNLRERVRERKYAAEKQFGHDSPQYKALEEEDTADKFIITSFYGVNGFAGFRLFDPECANAITAVGRTIITGLSSYLGERGFHVEYGDTDSVFVKLGTLEKGFEAKAFIDTFLAETLAKMGVHDNPVKVKYEKFFEWIIFKQKRVKKDVYEPVKKRYAAWMTWSEGEKTDYMYIRGFETRRSDASPVLKKVMEEFFNILKTRDIRKAMDLLQEARTNFRSNKIIDIAIPKKANRSGKLKTQPPHVRGVEYAMNVLGWRFDNQTTPSLLYLKRVDLPYPPTEVICIQADKDLPPQFIIDYDLMFEKVIRKKFEDLLVSMGYEWDRVMGIHNHTQSGMEAWF